MTEHAPTQLTLHDEAGTPHQFDMLLLVEVQGQDYAILTPSTGAAGADRELYAFRHTQTAEGIGLEPESDEDRMREVYMVAESILNGPM